MIFKKISRIKFFLEPIDVEDLDLGILPDSIPMQRKTTRGRPRIYPRIDDVLRYKRSLEITSGIEDSKVEVQLKKSESLKTEGRLPNYKNWKPIMGCLFVFS